MISSSVSSAAFVERDATDREYKDEKSNDSNAYANGNVHVLATPHRGAHFLGTTTIGPALFDKRVGSLAAYTDFLLPFDYLIQVFHHSILKAT